jgi:Fe2+ transport system protein FeoA
VTLVTGIESLAGLKKSRAKKRSSSKSGTDFSSSNLMEFKVSKIEGDEQICSRLREIGLRSGLVLQYLGRAPFQGPLFVQFKNSFWALRYNEAECIHVVGLANSSLVEDLNPQEEK